MSEQPIPALDRVALTLFTSWLKERSGKDLRDVAPDAKHTFTASAGQDRYALAVSPLFDSGEGDWYEQKREVEEQLGAALENGAYVLWLPPGAHLPVEEPGRSEFVFKVKMAAARLQSGQRTDLKIPVQLAVRKQDDEGSYMSALGGMQPVWSWFTNLITGVYTLDARALTRLPESREEREAIVNDIVEKVKPMAVDDRLMIEAEDSWTLQRIPGVSGFTIIGLPPEALPAEGETRRRLRRVIADATESLAAMDADLKVLLIPGLYLYASEENASIAVRGFDPSLYAPFAYIVLIADGVVKPIIAPRGG